MEKLTQLRKFDINSAKSVDHENEVKVW